MSDGRPAVFRAWPDWVRLAAVLLVGSILALGRYDWSDEPAFAVRAYTLSGLFFFLILTCSYSVARVLARPDWPLLWPLLGTITLLLNLPYRWLGIDGWFYYASNPVVYGVQKNFAPEWLGPASFLSFPRGLWHWTDWFMLALLCLGLLLGTGGMIFTRLRSVGTHDHRKGFLFLFLFALIVIEAWMHVSNRSPYTYITHFEQPESAHYVYARAMLADDQGHANADVLYFVGIEEYFQGQHENPQTLLIRRAFLFYLSSQVSYFLGHYHAFLLINVVLWLLAAASMYAFCRDLGGSPTLATSAAFLVGVGPGFIMYAAQPMAYLAGYAILAIVVCLYHKLVVASGLRSRAALYGAGVLIGLMMLTYDTFGWLAYFFAYPLLVRVSPLRALPLIALGVAIYSLFLVLIFQVFHLPHENSNDAFILDGIKDAVNLFRHPNVPKIVSLVREIPVKYGTQLMRVLFYVPVVLAGCGVLFPSSARAVRWTGLLLLLPSFATFLTLHFAESYLGMLPRFNFAAYLGVTLLAAGFLDRVTDYFRSREHRWLARFSLALPLSACAILGNIDAFGLRPDLYYHFYNNSGGNFP
jgi:hypothetical protein